MNMPSIITLGTTFAIARLASQQALRTPAVLGATAITLLATYAFKEIEEFFYRRIDRSYDIQKAYDVQVSTIACTLSPYVTIRALQALGIRLVMPAAVPVLGYVGLVAFAAMLVYLRAHRKPVEEHQFDITTIHNNLQRLIDTPYENLVCVGDNFRPISSIWLYERLLGRVSNNQDTKQTLISHTKTAATKALQEATESCGTINTHFQDAVGRPKSTTADNTEGFKTSRKTIQSLTALAELCQRNPKHPTIASLRQSYNITQIVNFSKMFKLFAYNDTAMPMMELIALCQNEISQNHQRALKIWVEGMQQAYVPTDILHDALEAFISFRSMGPENLGYLEYRLVHEYDCRILAEEDADYRAKIDSLSNSPLTIAGKQYTTAPVNTQAAGEIRFALTESILPGPSGPAYSQAIFQMNPALTYMSSSRLVHFPLPVLETETCVLPEGVCSLIPASWTPLNKFPWKTAADATTIAPEDIIPLKSICNFIIQMMQADKMPANFSPSLAFYNGDGKVGLTSKMTAVVDLNLPELGTLVDKITTLPLLRSYIKQTSGMLQHYLYAPFYEAILSKIEQIGAPGQTIQQRITALRTQYNCPERIDMSGLTFYTAAMAIYNQITSQLTEDELKIKENLIPIAMRDYYISQQLCGSFSIPKKSTEEIAQEILVLVRK
jgi:hypothetical protein